MITTMIWTATVAFAAHSLATMPPLPLRARDVLWQQTIAFWLECAALVAMACAATVYVNR